MGQVPGLTVAYPGGAPATWHVTVWQMRMDDGRSQTYYCFEPSADVRQVVLPAQEESNAAG